MLFQYLRWATFAGIGSIILFMPLNGYFGRLTKSIGKDKYKLQDARIKTMNEVLAGIRVVKLYGWEISFMNLVKKLRAKELNNLIKTSLVSTLSNLSMSLASFVVVVAVSFGVYVLIDENNVLDPNTAFVSLVLIDMLGNHLKQIPQIVTGLMGLNVSLTRIRKFLLKDEIKTDEVCNEPIAEHSIEVENVNLGWSKSEETLSNLSIKVKKGSLVAIVGKVGSGKSSFFSGLVNQMHKLNESGKINIDGKIALVSQQPWIQNATIKNNILFNNPYNEELYKKVLESCSLLPDLDVMLVGDETEIGEKGDFFESNIIRIFAKYEI
jgi:ABC-type multidrug transport system fused ATPase/permease subunit